MPSWQGKSKGTTTGYRIFVNVLRHLGLVPAYFMLRFVALYYVLFSWSSTKETYSFFSNILGYNPLLSLVHVYKNYFRFGQTLIDKIVLMSGIAHRFHFHFDGEQFLHQMAENGKGGLLISAHVGNWEIAGFLLRRINTRTSIVMYDGEHRKIKDYLAQVMQERAMNVIVVREDLSHIYKINEALHNNEFVCIHADRFMEGNKTVRKLFLGKEASFPAGPFVLAATLQVPVSFVFALKESNLRYHFYASPPKVYEAKGRDVREAEVMSDFVKALEERVRQYPTQWFNYYNFWKV